MEGPIKNWHVDKDITIARTIQTDVYHDENTFRLLLEKIFVPSWQFITTCDELPTQESIFPFSYLPPLLEEPMVAVRDGDDKFYVLSNVCTHRGNLLAMEKCHSKHGLICKYHGRKFSLQGKMLFMPEFKEVKDFPAPTDDLPSFPVKHWGNWLFTSMSDFASPSPAFQWMSDRLDWLPYHAFKYFPEYNQEYFVEANWALYCENYLEGFHIPFVHAGLNQVLDFGSYETICREDAVLQIGYAKGDELCFDLPADHIDAGKKVAAYYYFVFPNLMFNFYPWGLSLNIVTPLSVSKTKVTFKSFILDVDKFNQGAGSDLNTVEMEDEAIVENVQKGTKSRAYQHGRYSVTRETGTHHFHRLLAAALNGRS